LTRLQLDAKCPVQEVIEIPTPPRRPVICFSVYLCCWASPADQPEKVTQKNAGFHKGLMFAIFGLLYLQLQGIKNVPYIHDPSFACLSADCREAIGKGSTFVGL
jgi:hypothetical protein